MKEVTVVSKPNQIFLALRRILELLKFLCVIFFPSNSNSEAKG
jgi:hypothetical protein